jgi:hypothetical protein
MHTEGGDGERGEGERGMGERGRAGEVGGGWGTLIYPL